MFQTKYYPIILVKNYPMAHMKSYPMVQGVQGKSGTMLKWKTIQYTKEILYNGFREIIKKV